MDELPKIDLSSAPKARRLDKIDAMKNLSPKSRSSNKFLKIIFSIFIVLILLVVVSVFAVVLPGKKAYDSAQKTYKQAKIAFDAVKKQDIVSAGNELINTKKELEQTQKDLHAMAYLQFIPIVNWYYNDIDHLLKAGFHSLEASMVLVEAVEPYADVLGLKGQGSFTMGSAEQRIQTAILTMGKITPKIDDISEDLVLAKNEIDQVDPNHYPAIFGGAKIKTQLTEVKQIVDQGVGLVDEARPLIKVLPSLLGESEEKKYLVLFQNDAELRPTGGFITAYAVFNIDKGNIRVDKSDDIYNLDNSIRVKRKAPEEILTYLPKVTTFNIRDTNLSPDFLTSMKTFNSLYEDASGKIDVDGIIAIDTSVLVSTIKILDDEVYAGGIKFTSQIDKRCNCPQVIYQLESLISTPKSIDTRVTSLASVQAQRKDILGTLLYAVMQKALKSSPKLYWGPLMQDLITQTNEKHVLFYVYDKDAQKGIEALNAAGQIKAFEGDYFHINDANMGGAKSNLFVDESVEQNYEISTDGSITKKVTISYKNPHPPSDCNLERGNLCLNGILRNWFRIYVPKGSTLIDSKGSEIKLKTKTDLGKTVFEGFLQVRPQGTATFTISYKLPFKLSGKSLPVLIQKQPGTYDNEHVIKVNGGQVDKFKLLTDKELIIKR